MKSKDMTLGEVLIEFVEAYVEYRISYITKPGRSPNKEFNKMHELRKGLLNQLNFVEIIFRKEKEDWVWHERHA